MALCAGSKHLGPPLLCSQEHEQAAGSEAGGCVCNQCPSIQDVSMTGFGFLRCTPAPVPSSAACFPAVPRTPTLGGACQAADTAALCASQQRVLSEGCAVSPASPWAQLPLWGSAPGASRGEGQGAGAKGKEQGARGYSQTTARGLSFHLTG